MRDLVACVGEPLLDYHLLMLAILNDVNAFNRAMLVLFQNLAEGEEQGFRARACNDEQVQRIQTYWNVTFLRNGRLGEETLMKPSGLHGTFLEEFKCPWFEKYVICDVFVNYIF